MLAGEAAEALGSDEVLEGGGGQVRGKHHLQRPWRGGRLLCVCVCVCVCK